jgi:hypothetical protein
MGKIFTPKRILAAFVRGRNSQSLYTYSHDRLLDMTVAKARAMTGVDDAKTKPSLTDGASLCCWFLFSLILGALQLGLLCVPLIAFVTH